jgi:hypothetical protein
LHCSCPEPPSSSSALEAGEVWGPSEPSRSFWPSTCHGQIIAGNGPLRSERRYAEQVSPHRATHRTTHRTMRFEYSIRTATLQASALRHGALGDCVTRGGLDPIHSACHSRDSWTPTQDAEGASHGPVAFGCRRMSCVGLVAKTAWLLSSCHTTAADKRGATRMSSRRMIRSTDSRVSPSPPCFPPVSWLAILGLDGGMSSIQV